MSHANNPISTVVPSSGGDGVRVTKCRFYGAPIWSGTESALVQGGVVKAEWLPGKAGNNRMQQTVLLGADGVAEIKRGRGRRFRAGDGQTLLTITKTGATRFRVEKEPTREEFEAGRARWDVEREAHEAEMEARRLEAREVEDWDPCSFRLVMESFARMYQQMLVKTAGGADARREKKPAHQLGQDDRQRIEKKFDEVVAIIQSATVAPVSYPSAQLPRSRPTLSLVKG